MSFVRKEQKLNYDNSSVIKYHYKNVNKHHQHPFAMKEKEKEKTQRYVDVRMKHCTVLFLVTENVQCRRCKKKSSQTSIC